MMVDHLGGTPTVLAERFVPVIPSEFQIYNSYAIDPTWQIKFTVIWTSVLAFTTLLSIPYVYRSFLSGRLYQGLSINESFESSTSGQRTWRRKAPSRSSNTVISKIRNATYGIYQSLALWTLPMPNLTFWKGQIGDCCRTAYFTLSVSQIILVLSYMAAVVACFVVGAQLTQNSNRPGFIALAQLPLIVLLSLKSPLPLPVFLPTLSYEHYNFLHRWTGRTLFITVTVHGGMWLNQFMTTNQWDQVWAEKTKRGMIAYGLMGAVVITSLKPVRRICYQLFWIAHVCLFVGFFAAISYHTPYSRPWIYPCAAIYGYDLLVRMLRYRIKDATLVPVDQTLTMIHIPDCDSGWLPTQHVLLRVMKGSGIFESHPFTITNAPSMPGSASPRGIILYAKVSGDWTRRLHSIATDLSEDTVENKGSEMEKFLQSIEGTGNIGLSHPGKKVTVMIDGPYGGLKMDLGDYETVLLVAGGSGITFVLGAIEEAIRVKAGGHGPILVQVAWVVKDMSTIEALLPTLSYLHTAADRLDLAVRYHLYLSNPPHPLPSLPLLLPTTTKMSPYRPEVAQLVREALSRPAPAGSSSDDCQTRPGGGLAVIACGPEGIVMEARNAVAGLGLKEKIACGGVAFHGECYSL